MAWGQYANARARHRDRTSDQLEAHAGFRLLHAAFAPRVGDQVVLDRLARPPGGERLVNASRAVHDPLSCCLDLTSGEMPDLR